MLSLETEWENGEFRVWIRRNGSIELGFAITPTGRHARATQYALIARAIRHFTAGVND